MTEKTIPVVRGVTEPLGLGLERTDDVQGVHARLNEARRALFRANGEVRVVKSGEVLVAEGDDDYDFFVVESGAVAIVQGYGDENRVFAVAGPHEFLGELSLLTGTPALRTDVVRDAGEVIQVPRARLLEIASEDEDLANFMLRAVLARRSFLIGVSAGLRLVGSRFSSDTQRLREFLARNRMPHQLVDLEDDPDADALLKALAVEPAETPVVVWGGGVLRNPSNAKLAAKLGLRARGAPTEVCDLLIVGGGPAGLAAAVYGASEGLDTQAIDTVALGGQAGTSSRIDNYPGFPNGVSGGELATRLTLQAGRFGARLDVPAEAVSLVREDDRYALELASGEVLNGRTVIVATGVQYRRLDVPGLEPYDGVSVYYAATQIEARMCPTCPVVIVGSGNAAGQAAMFLSRRAVRCRLVIRGRDLAKSMSRYLVDEIERNSQIEVLTNREVVALEGDRELDAVVVADTRSGERQELEAKALFVFIGACPNTDWLRGQVATDDHGFLLTGPDVPREDRVAHGGERPYLLETSQPGLFAAGDVRYGSIKRVASAIGEGAAAVRLVHERVVTG
jgi:thioredoxin reductase (NADPH)